MGAEDWSPSRLYCLLRRLFRRPIDAPLALSVAEYEAAEHQFVSSYALTLVSIGSEDSRDHTETGMFTPFSAVSDELERLQLVMYFNRSNHRVYDNAKRQLDSIIAQCIPPRTKSAPVQSLTKFVPGKMLPLPNYVARRVFFWALVKGDWKMLTERNADTRRAFRALCELYSDPELLQDRLQTSALTLAAEDACNAFDLRIQPENLFRQMKKPS